MGFRINWQAMGIGASLICAIHCAITPLLLSSLPLFGINLVHNIWVEMLLLGTAFVIGISTLWHGYRRHHHRLLTLGVFTLGIGLFVLHQFVDFPYSTLFLVLPGVAAILSAHLLNHRFCRQADHCHSTDCNH